MKISSWLTGGVLVGLRPLFPKILSIFKSMKRLPAIIPPAILFIGILSGSLALCAQAPEKAPWVKYEGAAGPGKGKTIVLVSGDEEYRSEEALPMLAQIFANRYGFTCVVLFPIDPVTGEIDAMYPSNIPGLENLTHADLLILFTRFRELPENQMKFSQSFPAGLTHENVLR